MMKIGLVAPFNGRPQRTMDDLRTVAIHAEGAGIDSIWFPEHVVFFPEYTSKYPYSPDGDPGFGKRQGIYDPLFACTVVASATQKIRTGTAVIILPQRNPLILAQEAVAVDHASNGRFDLGIGIGWSSEEFAALDVPWANRGKRTDEYLAVMKALWTDELVSFHGEYVNFTGVIAEPKPLQTPSIPIWVGGGAASMRRAAVHGTGWYGWNIGIDEIGTTMAELDEACAKANREPATMGRKLGMVFGGTADDLSRYIETASSFGVTEVVLALGINAPQLLAGIDAVAGVAR